jgi:6-pyruvoyltetrahydropterin/6-carboxytetrahydropterin synthase
MRTELARVFRFEAAHLLPNVPEGHKCRRLHGHSFRITVRIGGPVDERMGWVVDFGEVARAWQPLHDALDHHYLNEVEGLENPTSEMLARWILERFRLPGASVRSVTVAETCTAECTVYADDTDEPGR